MSAEVNRHGLKRDIPAEVARSVRQRCGFGCIVCGSAFFDYDHLDPEFKDAKSHEPDGIILLCPNHHRAKGGFLSRETLRRHAMNPCSKLAGFSHTLMDIAKLTIEIGPVIAERVMAALEVKHIFRLSQVQIGPHRCGWLPFGNVRITTKAVWFEEPEEEGAPLRLNARINAADGQPLAWIENNVWHGSTRSLDIRTTSGAEGSHIHVRDPAGAPVLDLRLVPPRLIAITKLVSRYGNRTIEIVGDKNGGCITVDGKLTLSGKGINASNSLVAISL